MDIRATLPEITEEMMDNQKLRDTLKEAFELLDTRNGYIIDKLDKMGRDITQTQKVAASIQRDISGVKADVAEINKTLNSMNGTLELIKEKLLLG